MSRAVFIGLGSNLGDRLANLRLALEAIRALPDVSIQAVSHAFESEPWGVTEQQPFANAVAHIETRIPSDRLLGLVKDIEVAMGRRPGVRYGPRVIDLDLLLAGDEEWQSDSLTLPHPRLAERDFVVTPLLEIAPDVRLPDGSTPTREAATEGRVLRSLGLIPGFEDLTPAGGVRAAPSDVWEADAGWEEVASVFVGTRPASMVTVDLMFDAALLAEEGIPVAWEPFAPGNEINPWHLPVTYRLLVPASFAADARALLAEARGE